MASVEKLLREEIARLSRKEVKKMVSPLKKRVVSLGKALSGRRKKLVQMERHLSRLERKLRAYQPERLGVPLEKAQKARISPRLVKAQRKRLGLNQVNFARLLDVSAAAVRSWEQGRTLPRRENLAAFVAVRVLKRSDVYGRLGISPKRKKMVRRKKRPRRKKRSRR